jgi:hypothetical protein
MAKTKKSKTLKKGVKGINGIKGKRKMHNTKKRVRHGKNYINIDNTGLTKVIYTEGNKSPKKTIFKWDGKYDGKNANIHMNLNVDGKKTHSDLKLTNNDLMKILGANVVDKPIDKRLELLDESVSNMYASPLSHSSVMILAEEPQIIPAHSNVPVFINEMPEEQEQMMIVSSSLSPSPSPSPSKKGKKRSKSQKS